MANFILCAEGMQLILATGLSASPAKAPSLATPPALPIAGHAA